MEDATNSIDSLAEVPAEERKPRVVPGRHYKQEWERYGFYLNLRLDKELKEKLDALAVKHRESKAVMARWLMREGIDSMAREEKRRAEREGY